MSDELVNQVDTSSETVQSEWQRIANEHAVGVGTKNEGKETLVFDGVEGVEFIDESSPVQAPSLPFEQRVDMAQVTIQSALIFAVDMIGGVDVSDDQYKKVSRAWAVVICKYFEGGIFEFLGKYKDEVAAVAATIGFVKVVSEAFAAKKAKDVSPKNNPKKGGVRDEPA